MVVVVIVVATIAQMLSSLFSPDVSLLLQKKLRKMRFFFLVQSKRFCFRVFFLIIFFLIVFFCSFKSQPFRAIVPKMCPHTTLRHGRKSFVSVV